MSKTMNEPRPAVKRSVRLARPIDANGKGVVTITAGKESGDYGVTLFKAYGGEGLGVELRKADGTTYHVHVDEAGTAECDCRGHVCHGHCKHAAGMAALLLLGKLRPAAGGLDALACLAGC